jgi:hypothetical protein
MSHGSSIVKVDCFIGSMATAGSMIATTPGSRAERVVHRAHRDTHGWAPL